MAQKRPRVEGDDEDENCDKKDKAEKMNVVLALCGSFSPITFLHLRMLELGRDFLEKTGRYIVRGGLISPVHDAYGKKGLISSRHRLAMCNLAVKDSSWIRVSDWETSQAGWTVTAKALASLQQIATEQFPGDNIKLRFLCGADLLESFAKSSVEDKRGWDPDDIRQIVTTFPLVVISRFGSNPEQFVYESDILYPLKKHIDIVTEWIPNDVSSTKIRRSLARGESVRYLIPDPVIEYIERHGLYQAAPTS